MTSRNRPAMVEVHNTMQIQKPTIGRIIEVAIRAPERPAGVVRRPAIVVQYWEGGDMVNCKAFLDGGNDAALAPLPTPDSLWLTSIHYNADGFVPDGQVATWRYPARCDVLIDV